MIENYTRLSSRMFTATVVGKDKNGRKITEGRETYKTPSGVYEIKDWARLVEKAAEADGLLPLLEQIKRHVKEYASRVSPSLNSLKSAEVFLSDRETQGQTAQTSNQRLLQNLPHQHVRARKEKSN